MFGLIASNKEQKIMKLISGIHNDQSLHTYEETESKEGSKMK